MHFHFLWLGRMAYPESVETSNDLISNTPALVMDNILKRLPISIAAKTSILSRTWRRMWLSCQYLSFDAVFWRGFCKLDGRYDWGIGSRIISNVLFHHTGSIHSFHLELWPCSAELLVAKHESLSQWLSFISRTCPKKIVLIDYPGEWCNFVVMPSYIFHCTVLTELKLQSFLLNAPPFDFKGFHHLKILELRYMKFNNDINMLWIGVVAKCPCLVSLTLENCLGMDVLDIDASGVEKLIIKGAFDSLHLKKAPRLTDISLCSTKSVIEDIQTVVATINRLATSYELQCLAVKGNLCKLLGAGGINKSLPVAFNYLHRLCLMDLALNDSDVFCFTLSMLQSCPVIKYLEISIKSASNVVLHKYEYCSREYRLGRLQKAQITGISGTSTELKLIEYLLAISDMLKTMVIKSEALDAVSELKVLRQVTRFPRASAKAMIVCFEE